MLLQHFLTATQWGPSQPSPSAVLRTLCSSTSSLPPSTRAPFGASKLFYIELDQCISLFKEAFPPENMLRRKLPQAVGHKGKKDYDAKVLQAKYPYLKDLGRSLILRMETPQSTDCVSLVGLA